MAKKSIPKRYVKLGPLAGGFADPYSLFKIAKGQVKELVTQREKTAGKIKAAIRGGHLAVASEAEFEEYQESLNPVEEKVKEEEKEPTREDELMELTKDSLTTLYKDTYQVSDEEVEAFSKLKHDDMVVELLALEEDND